MKKRFFYAAIIDSSNQSEVRLSGCFDSTEGVDAEKIANFITKQFKDKGYEDISVHISQLNFLMDIDDANS